MDNFGSTPFCTINQLVDSWNCTICIISQIPTDWMGTVCEQPSSGCCSDVQWVWASTGPLNESKRPVLKTLQHCLGCMLWVFAVLKGELRTEQSAQSWVGPLFIWLHCSFPQFVLTGFPISAENIMYASSQFYHLWRVSYDLWCLSWHAAWIVWPNIEVYWRVFLNYV